MAKKSKKHTPKTIVAAWHKEIVKELKPWFLEKKCFTEFEPKLRTNIAALMARGNEFGPADMKNSLRVARDMAKICKILQPKRKGEDFKRVTSDTFEAVLFVCAVNHRACRTPASGGGGWCTV